MQMLGDAKTMAFQNADKLNYEPGAAKSAGDIVDLGKGVVGAVDGDITATGMGNLNLATAGCRWARTGSTTVFAVGEDVWWDDSLGEAVVRNVALDGAADTYLGVCVKAKASGEGNGVAYLPRAILDKYTAIQPQPYEFDCDDDNGDVLEHMLIPASQNKHGLILLEVFGRITEVMAGSSEDQGIVTVEDGADNVLCTLTPSDTAADVVGDRVNSSVPLGAAATGDPLKIVAAGVAVQGFVSQQTSGGTPAGKMVVHCWFLPLV